MKCKFLLISFMKQNGLTYLRMTTVRNEGTTLNVTEIFS
jgi:hypothetical protein